MGNANKTVTLTVDVQAKLNDLQGQVKKMQEMLGGLKMPDGLTQGTTKTINELFEKIKSLQNYTEGNKMRLVDERKVQSEFNAIQKDFASLVNNLNKQGAKIKIGDNKTADALRDGMAKYKKVVDESTRAIQKQEGEIAKTSNRLDELKQKVDNRKEYQRDMEAAVKAAEERVQKTKAIEEKYRADRKAKGWDEKKIDTNFRKTNDYKEQLAAVEALAKANEELGKAERLVGNAEKDLNTKGRDYQKTLEEQTAEADKLKEALNRISEEELQKLKDGLSKLQGEGGIKLDFDPQNIQSIEEIEQKLEEIDGQDLAKVSDALRQFFVITNECRGRTEELNNEVIGSVDKFKKLDDTLETFKKKAAYFFGITNAVNLFKRAVQSAYNTVKDLDKVMTETAVVTDFSVGDMWAQLPEYTRRANELGVSIHDAYEAATLYYQQGLKTNEVIAVSNETLKMARIAGLGAAEATDRMTNALRGFNMEINEESAQRVNDVYSKLAAITAADTDEISTAMTKVASLAHNANMEFETTSAFLSQMIETTRESAETAGTALKTVIARFSEVKKLYNQGDLMGTDEEGEEIDVNKVSQALRSAGINLNEYLTGAKGLDDIFIELASKWEHLDMVQQRYIATMAAGSRQQSRFIAMMSDYDRTMQLVDAANTSAGASQKQFEKTLDSLQSKLAQLQNSWNTFLMGIADNKAIKFVIDTLTKLLNIINILFSKIDEATNSTVGSLARIGASIGIFITLKTALKAVIVHYQALAMAKKEETAATALEVALGKYLPLLKKEESVATAEETVVELANAKAKKANAFQTALLSIELFKATAGTLAFAAAATAAVAVVVAVGVAVWYLVKKYRELKDSSPEKVLERAEKSAEGAAKATDDLRESYNNLKDSISGLDEKYETLENMTRGSQEWLDTVREINSEILDLMNNYEEVQIVNENGVLKIANPDEIQSITNQRYTNAQSAQIRAQQSVSEAELRVKYKDTQKKIGVSEENQEFFDKLAQEIANGVFTGTKDQVKEQIGNEWKKGFDSEIEITDEVIQSLKEYGQALNENKTKIDAYSSSLTAIASVDANLLKGTETYAQNFMSSDRMDSLYIKQYNNFSEGFDYFKDLGEIFKELGYKDAEDYKEKTGVELTAESARAQLAQIRAQKEATKSMEVFSRTLTKLPDYVQKMYSRADGLGLTQADLTKANNRGFSYDAYKNATTDEERAQEAQKLIDAADAVWETLEEDEKAAFGSIEDFEKEYSLSILHTISAFEDVKESFDELGISIVDFKDKLSAGTLNDFANNLELIFKTSGRAGVKEIESQVAAIVNSLDSDKAEEFMNALDSVDWSSANAIETFKGTLDGLKISVPEDQIDQLTSSLIDLGAAARKVDLENIAEDLEKIGGLAAKVSSGEQGYTGWSKESMEAAVAAGIDQSDFQYDALTNTWTYVGNSLQEVADALNAQTKELTEIPELERQIKNGEIFKSLGGEDIDTNNLGELQQFLFKYANEADDLSLDQVGKNYFSKEELQKLYNGLSANALAVQENTEVLNSAKELQQQIEDSQKSILENAAAGNTSMVVAQARQYGVSDQTMKTYSRGLIDTNDLAQIGNIIKEASDRGFDVEEINKFAQELKRLGKTADGTAIELAEVTAAQVALANARITRGMKELVNSYEDWTALIKEDGSLMTDLDFESEKILSDMKQSVNDLLNTSENLSETFYENNMALIKKAVEEGGDALVELRIEASKDIILPVGVEVDDSEVSTELNTIYDFIRENTPTMEIGTEINDGPFVAALNDMIKKTSMSVAQIQAFLNSIGFSAQLKTEKKKMTIIVPAEGGNGFKTITQEVEYVTGLDTTGKGVTYTGGVGSGSTYNSKNSGGGGSGGSEKTDTWENPYDELYNLTEKINEALRTREALERRYEKLVKKTSSTVNEVTKAYYDQIKHLRTEADLQYQMQAGRARQLNNVGNEYYMDSEGNRKTFSELGVTKYANYDQKTGLLQIDWDALEALEGDPSKVEEGKAAEAYISRLEELQDQFEEVRDKLWDIEDQIEELREEAIENYLTFEDRVMDALVNSYQKQIDEYSALSDEIKEQTDAIIKGIQDDVELSRQIRDNTKKEEDIADKEARLAYLKRDTSGANALEIKKLEEEIANARENYSDTLVDQQLEKLQEDANSAAEQRQHQIEIMQNQLDVAKENGTLWTQVWDLINTATAEDGTFSQNSELVMLLEESEAYQSLSRIGQMKWWEEVAEAFKRAQVGLSEAEDKYGTDANGDGKVTNSGTQSAINDTANKSSNPATGGTTTTNTTSNVNTTPEGKGHFAKVGSYAKPRAQMPNDEVKELQQALNDAGFTDDSGKELAVDGSYGPRTMAAVKKLQIKLGNVRVDGYYGPETRGATLKSIFKAYKTGGLADYTGPAWLDGSKTHPELVLNAKDTENFIELKNILAHTMSTQGAGGINGGDTYFEVNIDAEIGSDYDVEKLADKIKRMIYNDSSYRNVNSINFTR